MDECRQIQTIMIDALYGELNTAERERFRTHLAGCPVCAEHYAELQFTLTLMDRREYPAPDPGYWLQYDEQLEQRLSREGAPALSPGDFWWNLRGRLHWKSRWGCRIAAAVALVLLGIILGRTYWAPPAPVTTGPAPGTIPAQNAAVIRQTLDYLEGAKRVLMGLVNMDPEQEADFMQNFSVQQDVSQSLVKEAGVLQKKLASPQQEQLRDLVSELEMILRQIANLDEQYDVDEIRIIRMGVRQKFLLFKINVEEMNAEPRDTTLQQPSQKLVL